MSNDAIALRKAWEVAAAKDRHKEALAALEQLEALEPQEAAWSQRVGDTLRRVGRPRDAERAYERAMGRYAAQGFLPRAVAMAKTIEMLNPARVGIAAEIDQNAARKLQPPLRPPPPRSTPELVLRTDARSSVRPPPSSHSLDAKAPPSASQRLIAQPLVQAENAGDAPVFDDLSPDDGIVIDLCEEDVVTIEPKDATRLSETAARRASAEHLAKMATSSLFASLGPGALAELTNAAELIELGSGQALCRRGEPADALFALIEGQADVFIGAETPIARLVEGEIVGESCLLTGGVRQADVRACGPLTALRIGKEQLARASSRFPEIYDALFTLLTRRLVGDAMRTMPLFVPFDAATRVEVARMFEVRFAPAGTTLALEGRHCDALYVGLVGRFEATQGGAEPRLLAPPAVLGHWSLLSRAPESQSIRALDDSVVLRLPAARFGVFAAMYFAELLEVRRT